MGWVEVPMRSPPGEIGSESETQGPESVGWEEWLAKPLVSGAIPGRLAPNFGYEAAINAQAHTIPENKSRGGEGACRGRESERVE